MHADVRIGELYRDRTVFWNRWWVERIYTDLMGLPHAVVRNVGDPTIKRTIACPILRDRRRYVRLPAGAPAAKPEGAGTALEA